MKTKYLIAFFTAMVFGAHLIQAQSLSEKKFHPNEGLQTFTSVENVPSEIGSGQILVSSTTGSGSGENTIIMLVDDDGDIQWETIYDNTGLYPFDHDVFVKSHRIGFHPDHETILITGKGGFGDPTVIELEYSTGDVIEEYYYEQGSPEIYEGFFSAIHTYGNDRHPCRCIHGGRIPQPEWRISTIDR